VLDRRGAQTVMSAPKFTAASLGGNRWPSLSAMLVIGTAVAVGCAGSGRHAIAGKRQSHTRVGTPSAGTSCADGGRLGTQRSLGGKPVPFNSTIFHLTNMWLAKRQGIYIDVYAGALVAAPRRGALIVWWTNPRIGTPIKKSGIYAPAKPIGLITLRCVRGSHLFFTAAHGRGSFDLRSRRFVLR
jgi:hypothetical protein